MATIEQLLNRIEVELSLASGLDVQIHAEDTILAILRRYYNKFFEYAWWEDYLITTTYTLDGVTGHTTVNTFEAIRRVKDIFSIYYDSEFIALPRKQNTVNPTLITRKCYAPSTDATKMFKIFPIATTGDIHVIYRTRLADAVWETPILDTEINMDDEVLISATCYDYLAAEGSNPDDTQKHKDATISRLAELTKGDTDGLHSKSQQSNSYPVDWDQWHG